MKTNHVISLIAASTMVFLTGFASAQEPHHPGGDHTPRTAHRCTSTTCSQCSTALPEQAENEADRLLTQTIRRALVEDTMLSTYAKNMNIKSANGRVILRGQVNNKYEKQIIIAKAKQIAGPKNVEIHIETLSH